MALAPNAPDSEPPFKPVSTDAYQAHIPLPPDPAREPVLHALWRDMFEGAVTPEPLAAKLERNNPLRSQSGATGRGRDTPRSRQRSRNWAGAVASARDGLRFTAVGGAWTVPGRTRSGGKGDPSLVSIWVGLGGALPLANSMPQIGSEHGWRGGKTFDTLWCQWWLGKSTNGYLSFLITNPEMKPEPGDRIRAFLHVDPDDPRKVTCHLMRESAADGRRFVVAITGECGRPVHGSSAEWIVERPRAVHDVAEPGQQPKLLGGKLLRLPDMPDGTEVLIEQAAARLGDGKKRAVREVTLGRAALLDMVEVKRSPTRLARIVRPSIERNGEERNLRLRFHR